MAQQNLVRAIGNELGRVFRHLLPGVLIMAVARASHPQWFDGSLSWGNPWDLAVLGTLAFLSGNTWYIFHRYTLHELLAVAFSRKERGRLAYAEWLAQYVDGSNRFPSYAAKLRGHLLLRSAQVIYFFIVGEVLVFFAALPPAPGTVVARYRIWILLAGACIILVACWPQYLQSKIDSYAVKKHGGRRGAA